MQYDFIIEKQEQADRRTKQRFERANDRPAKRRPRGPYRSFPPAVQILTQVDPVIENKVNELAWKGHRAGRPLEDICKAISAMLEKLGFNPAISVQEVYTSNMPSYSGETVMTALLLLDIRQSKESAA